MDQNVFATAIQHLSLAQAAELAQAHYEMTHDTVPAPEPESCATKTEIDVGETLTPIPDPGD